MNDRGPRGHTRGAVYRGRRRSKSASCPCSTTSSTSHREEPAEIRVYQCRKSMASRVATS